jgi:hypothetical protein
LPSMVPHGAETKALAATGTDGKSLGPFLGPHRMSEGDFLRQTETEKGGSDKGLTMQKSLEKSRFSKDSGGLRQAREKMEPRGIEPLTSALRTLRSPS